MHATARAFAQTWLERATPDEVGELLAARPHIPAALDAELLRTVQAEHGNVREHDQLRRASRAASGTRSSGEARRVPGAVIDWERTGNGAAVTMQHRDGRDGTAKHA